jgi:hypothetical protein
LPSPVFDRRFEVEHIFALFQAIDAEHCLRAATSNP